MSHGPPLLSSRTLLENTVLNCVTSGFDYIFRVLFRLEHGLQLCCWIILGTNQTKKGNYKCCFISILI